MNQRRRTLRGIRFEHQGSEIVLVVTASVGVEIVIESVPLGEAVLDELVESIEQALRELTRGSAAA